MSGQSGTDAAAVLLRSSGEPMRSSGDQQLVCCTLLPNVITEAGDGSWLMCVRHDAASVVLVSYLRPVCALTHGSQDHVEHSL